MLVEKYTKGNQVIEIHTDDYPENPRDFDAFGTMACWHRRYILGDEQPRESPQEFLADFPPETVYLPLYLFDHSGLHIQTTPFACVWDSGRVGYIYVTPETMEKEKLSLEIANEALLAEVAVYDKYLSGEVYLYDRYTRVPCKECGHVVREDEDSCGGFYGINDLKESLEHDWGIKWEDWKEEKNVR